MLKAKWKIKKKEELNIAMKPAFVAPFTFSSKLTELISPSSPMFNKGSSLAENLLSLVGLNKAHPRNAEINIT